MAVPVTIADLSATEASNSPADTESITATTRPSDYLRAHATIIKVLANSVDAAAAGYQPLDATLTALAALNSTAGVVKQTGADTFTKIPEGKVLQVVHSDTGALATGTTVIPYDDTIPQITEGDQYMSLAITPVSATSTLRVDVAWNGSGSVSVDNLTVALFRDATASAIGAAGVVETASQINQILFSAKAASSSTSSTTFTVRAGIASAGTTTFNGNSGARRFGGVMSSSIRITEIEA